ncbi:MAG: prepilin-type N-terminal cleavage/methylation domain-containing protein [Rhodanobacteraceae bacterium]|nr:MAG: prepilin-type N-terminal cleavage/methylation domain-containing protein [Rhodanobacteraceae bacterium]
MDRNRHHARGFTLTELLITLAIAGILAMIGAPAMGSLLARTRNSSIESAISHSLRHARAAAVMHNARVLVCPSRDGRRCQPDGDWQHGWIVARDADHDGQPDAGVPVIATQAAMPTGARVVTSTGRRKVVFHPNGSAAGSNATFTICHARLREGKSVIVSNTGRVRLEEPEPDRLQACLAGLQQG